MRRSMLLLTANLLLIVLLCTSAAVAQTPRQPAQPATQTNLGTGFNFQGMLRSADGAVSSACDFRFALFAVESGGSVLGDTLFRPALAVVDGLFTTQLDFGAQFTGAERWLETAVRCPTGSGNYVILAPRQRFAAVPYALLAERVATVDSTASDFTAKGVLKSSRGLLEDPAAGALQLENTLTGNKWQINTTRDDDKLLIGVFDKNNTWSSVAFFDRAGSLVIIGDLYLNQKVTSDIYTTGALRSARGRLDDPNAGLLILDNTITNNRWSIATKRDSDNLEFWFNENNTNWNHAATIEHNGNVHVHGDSLIMVNTSISSGLKWGTTDSALGYASQQGDWSVDAKAGDLILRPSDGARLIFGTGSKATNHPAALTVEPSGLVSIPQLQGNGYIEANLQTPAELISPQITRFSQGDLLCWEEETAQLARCNQPASPLVVAVADANGKPLILGVEPVKVQGPVQAGDLLVSSATPGVAMAWAQMSQTAPPPGVVIAKALASLNEETGLLKAMILAR